MIIVTELSEWYCENKYPLDFISAFIWEENHIWIYMKLFAIPAKNGDLSNKQYPGLYQEEYQSCFYHTLI